MVMTKKAILFMNSTDAYFGYLKCYSPKSINPLTGDKMEVLYEKTMRKESNIKQVGYKVKIIWSCEFQTPKDIELNDIIKCNNKYRMLSNGSFPLKTYNHTWLQVQVWINS